MHEKSKSTAALVNTNENINLLTGFPGVSSEGIQPGAEHGKMGT